MKNLASYNLWYLAASGLMLLTFAVHLIAGGIDIYQPLRGVDLSVDVMSTLSVVWHVVSVLIFLMAGALLWLSLNDNPPLALFVGLCQAGFVLLFLGYGYVDTGNLLTMPQWTVFLMAGGLMWCGHKGRA